MQGLGVEVSGFLLPFWDNERQYVECLSRFDSNSN